MLTDIELKKEAWTWSFSKFQKYQECNEAYRLKYLEKIKVPPLTETPFFQGRVAHNLGERTFRRIQKGEVTSFTAARDALEKTFFEFADGLPWKNEPEINQAYLEARAMLESYIVLLEQLKLHEGEVYCEHWFGTYQAPLARPSGLFWVGAIDWLKIDRERNVAWIYDAKTSRSMRYLDRRQLTMYAAAVEQKFGVSVEHVGYLMLRNEEPKLYKVTDEQKEKLEAEMVAASQAIERGEFSVLPSMSVCGDCALSNGHCGHFNGWILSGAASAGEVDW